MDGRLAFMVPIRGHQYLGAAFENVFHEHMSIGVLKALRNGLSLRDVAADTDAADGPHGLGMQCHCTGVMPTGRACSDRPGFAKFARVTEMLVVPDENCGVVPRMSGASGSPVTPIFLAGSIN